MNGWIGVDLDGTLAEYGAWKGPTSIGKPIPRMVERVKKWIGEGREVRIVTARASGTSAKANGVTRAQIVYAIKQWCREHIGVELPVTNEKDFAMIELWDDRCVQVIPNTGERVDGLD